MALNGLPKSLEDLMCFLLKTSMIKSWNYYGGESHNTLTIRWVSHDSSLDNHNEKQADISYRQKSQSQVSRERKRFVEWKSRKDNNLTDLLENKSNILSKDYDRDSHIDVSPEHSSPVHAMDNAMHQLDTPVSQFSGDNSDQLSDDASASLLPEASLSAAQSKPQENNSDVYTDDCNKCKRWKVHTSRTDHNQVMRLVHGGEPFIRQCFDCQVKLIDTSIHTWMSDMDNSILKCIDCTSDRDFMRKARKKSCLLCHTCGRKHERKSNHNVREGKLRFNLKDNRMGFYFLEVD